MRRDFSLETYSFLLKILINQGYSFLTIDDFLRSKKNKKIFLRHDVDQLPNNSLKFARIQKEWGISGTYYFRTAPESWDEKVIKEIHRLGHEIGYHYENLTTCKGDINRAIKDFDNNLERIRLLAPVNTICMHGSPKSPFDTKDIWKHVDYHNYDLLAEPYFDVDFSRVLYLTDTGRRWNGRSVSVRDKMKSESVIPNIEVGNLYSDWKVKPMLNSSMMMSQEAIDFQNQYNFRSTFDIIRTAEEGKLPKKLMMTYHPQRWTDKSLPWLKELVWQNSKNVVKYFLIKLRK